MAVPKMCIRDRASRVNGACSLVLALASMPSGRELDDREDWACLENGMLNLRTLESVSYTHLPRAHREPDAHH